MSDSPRSRRWFAQLARPQAAPPWSLTDVLTTMIVLALAMFLLGPSLIAVIFNSLTPTPMTLLFGWLLGLTISLIFVLVTRQRQLPALRLGRESRWPLPYVVLVGVGAALTIDVIAGLLAGFRPIAALSGIGQDGLRDYLVAGLFMAVVQPLAEGLIFQGVMLPRLRASWGAWPGFLAATLFYTLYFVAVYATTLSGAVFVWYGVVMPLLCALVLNAVRIYTESTRAVIMTQIGMGLTFLLASVVLASR